MLDLFDQDQDDFAVVPLYVQEKLSASSLKATLSPILTGIEGLGNVTVNSPDEELYVELVGVTSIVLPSVQLRIAAIAYNLALPNAYIVAGRCAS